MAIFMVEITCMLRTMGILGAFVLLMITACSQEQQGNRQLRNDPSEGEAAHVSGSIARGAPLPPEYQVTENGKLIIGGDVIVRCVDIAKEEAPPSATKEAKRQDKRAQREQVKICTKAGFPPDKATR